MKNNGRGAKTAGESTKQTNVRRVGMKDREQQRANKQKMDERKQEKGERELMH